MKLLFENKIKIFYFRFSKNIFIPLAGFLRNFCPFKLFRYNCANLFTVYISFTCRCLWKCEKPLFYSAKQKAVALKRRRE